MNRTTSKIRQDFLNFFKEKKHIILPSSPLVPYNDSTLLFTNAGMNQFKEIFLGYKKTDYSRVATVQRCLRTGGKHNDLENVGYTSRHHTFFEMLGNFSFNDYFKKEAIEYAWELLTSQKWFNIPKNKLWVSVYHEDDETYQIWKDIIKIPSQRIIKIGDNNQNQYDSENFWQMGDDGPCGPCTEIFYDYGNNINNTTDFFKNNNHRFIEIWNIVFIEFNRISKTNIIPLKKKSIDTGMGLERIASILQNVSSNYDIDIFQDLKKNISQLSKIKDLNHPSLQIIADHVRACAYIISDNIIPSNEHRGYVLRRIIRRALRHGHKIGIKDNFFYKLVSVVIKVMGDTSAILKQKQKKIEEILKLEETQFSYTLEKGLKILKFEIKKIHNNILPGETAFYLYDTFGFPIDLTADVCREKNIKIDYNEYELVKNKQKKQSIINQKFYKSYNDNIIINHTCTFEGYKKNHTKSLVKYIFVNNKSVKKILKNETGIIFLNTTPFYPESGGQIGDIGEIYNKNCSFIVKNTKKYGNSIGHFGTLLSGKIEIDQYIYTKINQNYRNAIQLNHSATHLLHAALRNILGEHVNQKGSLVTDNYLRFDFSYHPTIEIFQIQKIEHMINMYIRHNFLIKTQILSLEEAKKKNAIALFENQYNSIVRVVFINNISIELCGGTHTKRTGDIGVFKITSQSSIASGIKRIEAVTGKQAIYYLHKKDNYIKDLSIVLKCNNSDIKNKVENLKNRISCLENQIINLQKKEHTYYIKKLFKKCLDIKGTKFLTHIFYDYEHKFLRVIIDELKKTLEKTIIILVNVINNRFTFVIGITKNLLNYITAINIMEIIIEKTNGKGGGKKEIAEGGGIYTQKLIIVLNDIKSWIDEQLNKK
ncbi:alanine--tRNA ligase [Buchnera aphidicola (Macrosiphoniella sanborni)]|uniref:Alanine--tRNA ligase n=1 Tax=Buchnera aphidicola (Macrosiphoniella sanborni) TaxID=1241865 RepID=A0A4D6YD76_9GAMM|nr:alanine--tRNA ligase [Buchnera aphidicola]QCI23928.1 alanine--tRNA ligase [Buchnera aphidicola (Macrosiphoniella sanborni)]